ncbi:hypothetical protein F4775DRAFT_590982 [Biscogniauxia sp. FL1348]|nr:hypothetical protein F4775DRAFT_590982 [Biscogniauxia sp. FL1348]
MEYLENGPIGEFITRINIMGGVNFIPNRFLWRCFLCLIRGCIAFAWPPTEDDADNNSSVIERAKAGEPSRVVHDDLHHFNLMFGPLVNDPNEPEHHPMVPSIKIIDFGSVYEKTDEGNNLSQPTAVTDNIYSIARIMCSLIELDNLAAFLMSPTQPGTGSFQAQPGGPHLTTTATGLLAAPNRLDPLLRATVCACAAPDPNQRPCQHGPRRRARPRRELLRGPA